MRTPTYLDVLVAAEGAICKSGGGHLRDLLSDVVKRRSRVTERCGRSSFSIIDSHVGAWKRDFHVSCEQHGLVKRSQQR